MTDSSQWSSLLVCWEASHLEWGASIYTKTLFIIEMNKKHLVIFLWLYWQVRFLHSSTTFVRLHVVIYNPDWQFVPFCSLEDITHSSVCSLNINYHCSLPNLHQSPELKQQPHSHLKPSEVRTKCVICFHQWFLSKHFNMKDAHRNTHLILSVFYYMYLAVVTHKQ